MAAHRCAGEPSQYPRRQDTSVSAHRSVPYPSPVEVVGIVSKSAILVVKRSTRRSTSRWSPVRVQLPRDVFAGPDVLRHPRPETDTELAERPSDRDFLSPHPGQKEAQQYGRAPKAPTWGVGTQTIIRVPGGRVLPPTSSTDAQAAGVRTVPLVYISSVWCR